jgi:O-antigen/teichoic acid export membrane protein
VVITKIRSAFSSGLGARAVWVIADQAVSSFSNAAVAIAVARAVSATDYGSFGLAFILYSLAISISQAVVAQVFLIRYSGSTADEQKNAAQHGIGALLAVASVIALALVAAALFFDGSLRAVLLLTAVLLPALMLQDSLRTYFVSRGTPLNAFLNGLIWSGLQIISIGSLMIAGVESPVPYVAAWGLSSAVAVVVGLVRAGIRPRFDGIPSWFASHRDVWVPTLANTVAAIGVIQLAFILIAAIGGVESVGALRGTQTLLGPLNIIGFAVCSFAIPEIVRRDLNVSQLRGAAIALTVVLVVVDAVWGGILLLVPPSVGEELLGETWANARDVLPAMVLFTITIGLTTGANAIMRALARPEYMLWCSLLLGPLVLGLAVIGVTWDGPVGASWGFAIAGAVVVLPTWFFLMRATRLGRRPAASETLETEIAEAVDELEAEGRP